MTGACIRAHSDYRHSQSLVSFISSPFFHVVRSVDSRVGWCGQEMDATMEVRWMLRVEE